MSTVKKIVGINFDHVLYIEIIEEEKIHRRTKITETTYYAVMDNYKVQIDYDTYSDYMIFLKNKLR